MSVRLDFVRDKTKTLHARVTKSAIWDSIVIRCANQSNPMVTAVNMEINVSSAMAAMMESARDMVACQLANG